MKLGLGGLLKQLVFKRKNINKHPSEMNTHPSSTVSSVYNHLGLSTWLHQTLKLWEQFY